MWDTRKYDGLLKHKTKRWELSWTRNSTPCSIWLMNGQERDKERFIWALETTNTYGKMHHSPINDYSSVLIIKPARIKGNEHVFQLCFTGFLCVIYSVWEQWKALIVFIWHSTIIDRWLYWSQLIRCCWLSDQLPKQTETINRRVTPHKSIFGCLLNQGDAIENL